MKQGSLTVPFACSCVIHVAVILLASMMVHNNARRQDYLPIRLVDAPRTEISTPIRNLEPPPDIKKRIPPTTRVEKPKETKPVTKSAIGEVERLAPPVAPIREEAAKSVEVKSSQPTRIETPPNIASGARVQGAGSEAGAGNPFGTGNLGVVPETETWGGGGTAGLGKGSGAPALPTESGPLQTGREAKLVQSVRATYPPMALRRGVESDVTLRIIVDAEGSVTKAEVIKSGGAAFDEEALRAVKSSRFVPAQKNGQNVSAEFTFIYRFRLQR